MRTQKCGLTKHNMLELERNILGPVDQAPQSSVLPAAKKTLAGVKNWPLGLDVYSHPNSTRRPKFQMFRKMWV